MIEYIHNEEKQLDNETYVWFIADCLSTDFKPVDRIYEGSRLFEKDTLKQFVYNMTKGKWEVVASCGGSGELPAVTEEDNGMILGVSNGEWNKVESSNGVLIVHEEGQIGSTKKVLNKTWQEIHDAGFSVLKMENMDGSGFNMLYIHEVFYNEIDGYVVSYGSLPSGGFAYFTNSPDTEPERTIDVTPAS